MAILDVESEFSQGSRNASGGVRLARMQREVPALLAPHVEGILRAAYAQVGLQRVGLRFSPLGLCTRPGAAGEPSVDETFLADAQLWEAAFTADFGHFSPTSPRSLSTLAARGAGPKALLLRLTMYHGAVPDIEDDDEMLHLSYVRCRHCPDQREETSPLTLNPLLLWASHTRLAPARTLLRDETTLARAQHEALLEHTYTTGGYSKEEWSVLYSEAMGVLPLFDAGSIPSQLIVDSRSRCFLVRALVHPDDGVAAAAARALQQIVLHHAGLRVPVFKSLLTLLGRIPPSDVAVQATLLGQFCHLSEARTALPPSGKDRQGWRMCRNTYSGCSPNVPRLQPQCAQAAAPMCPGVDRPARAAGPVQPGQPGDARAGGALPRADGVRSSDRAPPPARQRPPPRAAAPHHDPLPRLRSQRVARAHRRDDQRRGAAEGRRGGQSVA